MAAKTQDAAEDLWGLLGGVVAAFAVFAPSTLAWTPAIVALMLLWVIRVVRFAPEPADFFMTGWALLTILSLAWTISVDATLIAARTQAATLALFLLIRATSTRPRGLRLAVLGYLVGSLIAVWQLWRANGLRLSLGFENERTNLTALDQNYLAYSMCVGVLLLVLAWEHTRDLPAYLAILTCGAFLLLGINQAGTRGALVALILLTIWLVGFKFRPVLALRGILLALACGATLSLTGSADSFLQGHIAASARETGTLNGRLVIWPAARSIFEDHPWIGIGAGAFRDANPLGIVAHNAPLEVATGLGILGLFLFVGAVYTATVVETRKLDEQTRSKYLGGLVAVAGPISLSGHWNQAPALWVAVAVLTRLFVLYGVKPDSARLAGSFQSSAANSRPQSPEQI